MKYRLQYLRAIAALFVVIWHASYYASTIRGDNRLLAFTPGLSGSFGVTLFFVISGYLMATLAKRNSASQFMLHRITRIYPIYWIVALVFFAVNHTLGFGFTLDFPSLALLPGDGRIYPLGVEWTLPFELSFYLVIFIIIAVRATRALTLLAVLWTITIVILLQIFPNLQQGQFPRLSHLLVSAWTLPFVLGLLIPSILGRGVVTPYSWVPGLLLVGLASVLPSTATYILPLACVCLVHWAVSPRSKDEDRKNEIPALTRFGDWSYALYLCHVPIVLWLFRLAPPSLSAILLWSTSIALSLAVAAGFGVVDLAMYRRLKQAADKYARTGPVKYLGIAVAMLFLAYGVYAEVQAWRHTNTKAFADQVGQKIAAGHPTSLDSLAIAVHALPLTEDPALMGYADKIICSNDGTSQILGWAVDRNRSGDPVAVLAFDDSGAYVGGGLSGLARSDVTKALNLGTFGSSPGFVVDLQKQYCDAACSKLLVLVVSGKRYAILKSGGATKGCSSQ